MSELPNEFTDAKLEEMIGHYKRSKWMAEQEVLREAKEGAADYCGDADYSGGAVGLEADADRENLLDFLNGKMPGYVDTGLNFVGVEDCAAGHLLVSEKGKPGERYLLGAENLTLKGLLDLLAEITGLSAPTMKIPHGVALGVAYVESAFSRLVGKEPQIPVEGVKIAQHKMFVDASRAKRELGFEAGPVRSALERAVRWYVANGYVKAGTREEDEVGSVE